MVETKIETAIEADRQIVSLLSEGTYTAFASSLREVIVNAYDADATTVDISYDPWLSSQEDLREKYAGQLTVRDDGSGMSFDSFERFARIAPGRQQQMFSEVYRRPRVGRFGIGFLAVFPFCQELELRSTSAFSEELLVARFRCDAYFEKLGDFSRISDVPVSVERLRSPAHYHRVGTELILKGLSREARSYLSNKLPFRERRPGQRIFEIWDVDGPTRLRWELGQVLPIRWQSWSPNDLDPTVFGIPPTQAALDHWQKLLGLASSDIDPGLRVNINGEPIFKPWPRANLREAEGIHQIAPYPGQSSYEIVVPEPEEEANLASGIEWPNPDQMFGYTFLALSVHGPLEPNEMRGVQLRLKRVGIGRPLLFHLMPRLPKLKTLRRIYIEVHLVDGFDDKITIDRTSLKQTPWVRALVRSLRDKAVAAAERFSEAENKAVSLAKLAKQSRARVSPQKLEAEFQQYASEMGYRLERQDTQSARVDHDARRIVVPEVFPEPEVQVKGATRRLVWSDDPDLKIRLVRSDGDLVFVSNTLLDLISKDASAARRQQIVDTLLMIEELTQETFSALQAALAEVLDQPSLENAMAVSDSIIRGNLAQSLLFRLIGPAKGGGR